METPHSQPPIVFLHIPKTAGQTVHNELVRAVGQKRVSPIRLHTQVNSPQDQFPPGYALYSGHIDWSAIDQIQNPRFTFSILRDPKERIASFYFYLLKEARILNKDQLQLPQHAGKRHILGQSADDYFFNGDGPWQQFILDHYDNFYCRYFGSQRIRAGASYSALTAVQKIRTALQNLKHIDWVYSVEKLSALEDDLKTLYGFDLNLNGKRDNAGDLPPSQPRWPRLIERLERDSSHQKLAAFTALDYTLMQRLKL